MKRPPSPFPSMPATPEIRDDNDEGFSETMLDVLRPTKKTCCHASSCSTKKKRVTFAFDSSLQLGRSFGSTGPTENGSLDDREASRHNLSEGYPSMFEILTLEDIERLWYREKDVLNAKERTRSLVLSQNRDTRDCPAIQSHVDTTTQETTMMGLTKYSYERNQHKRSALWYVLQASRAYYSTNPEFVHALSKCCSRWTRRVAYCEAMALYNDLYGGSFGETSTIEPVAVCTHQAAAGVADDLMKDSIFTKSTPSFSMVTMVTPPASPRHSAGA